ncbi:MAG TPA: Fe-S cluster assembly protein SufD, partial [Sulfitobacter sp.]|nr:Fe-S cluster assembly protein SufD [Sulfitobacter sp.]
MAEAKLQETPTEAMIASLDMPQGGWAQAAREDALARVRTMGLPQRRDEYWKFTRPDTLTQAEPVPAAIFDHGDAPLFDDTERLRIVFVDGVFDAEASDDLSLEGVSIDRLAA